MLRRFNNTFLTTSNFSSLRFSAAAAASSSAANNSAPSTSSSSSTTTPSKPAAAAGAGGLRKIRVKSANRAPQTLNDLQKRLSKEMNNLDKSCSTSAEPVEKKPLTALQKRQLAMKDKLVFSLAPNAVYRIKLLMDGFNKEAEAKGTAKAVGIRVGVQKRGCSGLSYTVNYALESEVTEFFRKKDELEKKYHGVIPIDTLDSHVEQSGVHVFVDSGSLYYVVGTKMDYSVSDVEEKFEFNNPNKKSSCGCGDSWMPEM